MNRAVSGFAAAMREPRRWLVALMAMALLAACGGGETPTAEPEESESAQADASEEVLEPIPVKVVLGSTSFVYQTIFIAQEAGIFEDAGLEVDLVTANSGADAVTILLSGDADFAGTGAPEPIAVRAQGQDIRIMARLYAGLSGSVVLSKEAAEATGVSPDAPVEERLRALDGLTMAFSSPTTGFLPPMDAALNKVGVSVEKTYIKQDTMPAALQQGNIDAMIASSPVSDVAVVQHGGVLWLSGPQGDFPEDTVPPMTSVMASTERLVKENPDAVERMSQALEEAARFVTENNEEAKEIVAARFPDVDPDVFELAWEVNASAYSQPGLTADDIQQLLSILPEEQRTPAVLELDPAEYLLTDFVPQS